MAKSTPLSLDQGYDPTDVNSSPLASPLENAVKSYLINNQANNPQQDTSGTAAGIQTAQIGPFGSHILVNNPQQNWATQASGFIAGAGQQYLQGQDLQNRQKFIQGVHSIMSTGAPQQDKMNALLDLQAQHGTDYGIGINDIANKLGLTKAQPQNTLSPAQRLAQLTTGLQTGQVDPDTAHQQALNIDPNYQTTQPAFANSLNQSYTQKLDQLVKSKLGNQYEANPDFILTGKGNPYQVAGVGASSDPNFNALPPDQALAKLKQTNPGYAAQLQGYADGTQGQLSPSSIRSPRVQQMMQDMAFFYPGIDVNNINQRANTLKDFQSGKTSQQIQSLNTALGHLDTLNTLSGQLGSNKGWPLTNAAVQGVETATGTGDAPMLRQFNFTKNALSDEIATVLKGSSGTDVGMENIAKQINSADTPQMLKGVIQNAVSLMNSRLQAIGNKWSTSFNLPNDKQYPVLSPQSQQIVGKLGEGSQQQNGNNNQQDYSSLWS